MGCVKTINDQTVFLATDRPSFGYNMALSRNYKCRSIRSSITGISKVFSIYRTSTRAPKLTRPPTYQVTALFLGGG
jgi:hypothetical protein